MMKNNSIKVGTVRYLYDPFDMTIYEIYVQQIIENMFGEPDEIHAKTRIYIDETGVKDATKPWDNIKTISTYSYLANDLAPAFKRSTHLVIDNQINIAMAVPYLDIFEAVPFFRQRP